MTEAPSIKEALETAPTVVDQLERVLPRLKDDIVASFAVDCAIGTLKALATLSPPAGERREAIVELAVDIALSIANNDMQKKEQLIDILASGLVQDEAA